MSYLELTLPNFFYNSVHIKLASSQAALLSLSFFVESWMCCTDLGPITDWKMGKRRERDEREREKSPAPSGSGIWTRDLLIRSTTRYSLSYHHGPNSSQLSEEYCFKIAFAGIWTQDFSVSLIISPVRRHDNWATALSHHSRWFCVSFEKSS